MAFRTECAGIAWAVVANGSLGLASFGSPGDGFFSFFGFAARERQHWKGLRPSLFNPCSAPATPAQTWGTRPGGQLRSESSASTLTIQTVPRDDKEEGGCFPSI
jgi:hypothetical protein